MEHELRLYRDGTGVTHWLGWDDDSRAWYYVCDVNHEVIDRRDADHDAPYPTCVRCMCRSHFVIQRVGIGIANTKAISKLNFDLE